MAESDKGPKSIAQEKQQNSSLMFSTQIHMAADCFGAKWCKFMDAKVVLGLSQSNNGSVHIALHAYPVGFHP